jgi:hypothetical protein
MLLADPRIALCGIVGYGEPYLTAVLIPSYRGAGWFAAADAAEVIALVGQCCRDAPDYATPRAVKVIPLDTALAAGLVTGNGRIVRSRLAEAAAQIPFPSVSERLPR